jgi:hypothetical protein
MTLISLALKVGGKDYSYLSWADAMKIELIEFPDMQYEVTRDPYTNLPYFISFSIDIFYTLNFKFICFYFFF